MRMLKVCQKVVKSASLCIMHHRASARSIHLPAGTEEKRSSALFHELSHVKRADFLITILVRLSLALFWFNPLSWIAFRMLKNEQEKACDELVLRAGIKPSAYAASLLSFQRPASLAGALKNGLPEGFELESEFHEKSGTIVVKIKGHNTKDGSREIVENLVKEFKEVLKKSQRP